MTPVLMRRETPQKRYTTLHHTTPAPEGLNSTQINSTQLNLTQHRLARAWNEEEEEEKNQR